MAKYALSGRKNWQKLGGAKALHAEADLYHVFREHFEGTKYILHEKPKHLSNLYSKVKLPEDVISQIYNPNIDFKKVKWGISPDFAIENTKTKKILFGEIKRQDGWVEGTDPSAGRGNAHERLCKLFAPGLINESRRIGGITNTDILPFWVVFQGDITRDPKRNREIAYWFDIYDKNYFMWRPSMTGEHLTRHFDDYLKKYLDE